MSQVRRRLFLFAMGALLTAPRAGFPQPAQRKARIGMLIATQAEATGHLRAAFIERLAQLGWR